MTRRLTLPQTLSLARLLDPILSGGEIRGDSEDSTASSLNLPQAGFDRNQTLRRLIDRVDAEPTLVRIDPGAVYSLEGRLIARPASVEGWIEACSGVFPHEPVREFWEGVWNFSVGAWNFIDRFGVEPWRPPSFGFPLLHPPFWQGFSRNRRLFDDLEAFIDRCGLSSHLAFKAWIRGQVEFAFGRPWKAVPLGMAAVALNAPAESYWTPAFGAGQPNVPPNPEREAAAPRAQAVGGFIVECELSTPLMDAIAPLCLNRLEELDDVLWGGTLANIAGDGGAGRFYFRPRSEPDRALPERLDAAMESRFGRGWGRIRNDVPIPVERLHFIPHAGASPIPLEVGWPWTGWASAAHRILETVRIALESDPTNRAVR